MPANHTHFLTSVPVLLLAGLIVFSPRAEADPTKGQWVNSLKPAGKPGPGPKKSNNVRGIR